MENREQKYWELFTDKENREYFPYIRPIHIRDAIKFGHLRAIEEFPNGIVYGIIIFKEYKRPGSKSIGNKGDILFAITTSGKSKNIVRAIQISKKLGLKTILLTSGKAKKLKKNVNIFIPCPGSRVDRIQETQKIVGHIICELVEEILS